MTFEAPEGRIDSFYTLSEKAAWTMAKLLARAGVNLQKLEQDGIEPRHLSKQEVAEEHLLSRPVWIRVYTLDRSKPNNLDKNGNPYRRVEPLHEDEARKVDNARVESVLSNTSFYDQIPF